MAAGCRRVGRAGAALCRTARHVTAAALKDCERSGAKILCRPGISNNRSIHPLIFANRLERSASRAHALSRRVLNRTRQIPIALGAASNGRLNRRRGPLPDRWQIALRQIAGPAEWRKIRIERASQDAAAIGAEQARRTTNAPTLRKAGRRFSDSALRLRPMPTRLFRSPARR